MKIAVLSGKGGTGKTTVSGSLALSVTPSQYIDCDVEEPNGSIFLNPSIKESAAVKVQVPQCDMEKCDGCGECAKVCQFNALAVIKANVSVFPEICHHCGACLIACPRGAIYEVGREIGVVETDEYGTFLHGRLNVGEPISIPIIKELKKRMREDLPVILDCPPGASCTVVHSIEGCDYCILVTEPTPFGLHDFKIAVQLVRKMGIPFGVVVNKSEEGDSEVHRFCGEKNIDILMEIPFSRKMAESYSKGVLPVQEHSEWKERFYDVFKKVERGVVK